MFRGVSKEDKDKIGIFMIALVLKNLADGGSDSIVRMIKLYHLCFYNKTYYSGSTLVLVVLEITL